MNVRNLSEPSGAFQHLFQPVGYAVSADIQNDEAVINAYLGTEDITSLGGEKVAT